MKQCAADPQEAETEWAVRRDLALCYRLVALHGWDDLVATHISARLPGRNSFLINPFGMLFEEMTPEALVEIGEDGNKLSASPYEVNRAGFVIHSAVHAARPEAGCVIHLHTKDGVAVSATEAGLLPLNQGAMAVAADLAFHEYEGAATNLDERESLARDLGDKRLMLLRNHGTLAVGTTVAECFTYMYFLETACTTQVRTLSMNQPLHDAHAAVIEEVGLQAAAFFPGMAEKQVWPAMLRKAERLWPDFPH
ncbi:class II aldolase/adducin family protein [Henriciella mobilis]|uniref:Class II aldolase/adducin family protein n=1 Tax=Henriciella mobilis TaxID=2305467 RepID=A0A399RLW6_9PROT|nr:class II aldolase/adducin family protein [Henriciella mobilis]RIJ32740.1 class II aldolase/adducin family protein [Henriciella mobilis]